ncbi:MAG TPA: serine/threonine-protein kinase [Kofleriaceae bacterium]|nr:serine/threonine-protein kinase [Kofleriaceae bacterium]
MCRRIAGARAGEIEAHVADCASCRRLMLALASSVLSLGADDVATEPTRGATLLLREGTIVGRYRVLELLGAGGMGVVYAAHDPELDRRVALKLLHPELAGVELLEEAQAMAKLRHPNLVAVHDVGTHGEQRFVAMELIDGDTLRGWLRAPRPWREVVRVMSAAARGLAAAHAHGIVHRDFKPENVLVGRDGAGQICVTDFGLARPAGSGAHPAGTPAYMAPEQRAGEAADPRVDQYSFGVVLEEAIAGAPAWLVAIAKRAKDPDPRARFASMDALVRELERDRTRAKKTIAVATAMGAAAIIAVAGTRAATAPGDPCASAGAQDVWSSARAAELRRAFATTGLPYANDTADRSIRALDAWSARWSAMRVDACRATRERGVDSEDLLDLRMTCLDDRARDVRAVIAALMTPSPGLVEGAVPAIADATSLAACAQSKALLEPLRLPASPRVRIDAARLRIELAQARARSLAGQDLDAVAIDERIARDAAALGLHAIEAEALVAAGRAAGRASEFERAVELVERGLVAAESADHQLARANAYLALSGLEDVLGHDDEGERFRRQARPLIERLGDHELMSNLLSEEGNGALERGDLDGGIATLEQAIKIRGGDDLRVAAIEAMLGNAEFDRGNADKARAHYEHARSIEEQQLGRDNPSLIHVLLPRGVLELRIGAIAQALPLLARATELASQPGVPVIDRVEATSRYAETLVLAGRAADARAVIDRAIDALADDDHVWILLGDRVEAKLTAHDPAGALADADRAIAVRERQPEGPDTGDDDLSFLYERRGEALRELRRLDDALASYARSIELFAQEKDPQGDDSAALLGTALVALDRGRDKDAIAPLEQALALRTARSNDPSNLADVQFALARALGRTPRAIALATQARAIYAASEHAKDELAAVDAWLNGGSAK